MQTFDWIVTGNGLTGAALSYELARQGHSVLLLDQSPASPSATRFSYGGIPYWSGTTDLLRQLCRESLTRYQGLPDETGVDLEFRDLDLLLTVAPDQDPRVLAERYQAMEVPPRPISRQETVEREPQLQKAAISGALWAHHANVRPMALVKAYNHGLQKAGGQVMIATVTGLVRMGDRITGVTTPTQAYAAGNVAIAAGSHSRALLQTAGVNVPVYFTYAEILETSPLDISFQAMVMPADLSRAALEAQANRPEFETWWNQPDQEIVPPILDAGFVQFLDKTVRIGQISRINTSPQLEIDPESSEQTLRQGIAPLIPALAGVPGRWHSCQVAFSRDGLPLVGAVPGLTGVAVFSGFSSPFALVPAAAVHFAHWATGQESAVMAAVSPARFITD